jgi:hypothetical protein
VHFDFKDLDNAVCITIRSPRRWGPLGFSIVQVLIWLAMSAFVIVFMKVRWDREFDGSFLVFFIWFVLLTIAGLSRALMLLWDLAGKQIIVISSSAITVSHNLFGLGGSSEYKSEHIRDLRVSQWIKRYNNRLFLPFVYQFAVFADTPLAFDYGAKTYRFGNNIDESEARQIIAIIHQRFPQYR